MAKQFCGTPDENENSTVGSGINIVSYSSSSNIYTCPSDGYYYCNSWGANTATLNVLNSSGTSIISKTTSAGTTDYMFLKKGTKLYVTNTGTASLAVLFIPFVSY